MRAFITGISGFAGKYLAQYLLENNIEVFGIDRTGSEIKDCDVRECDVLDKEKVFSIIAEVKPDYVFHLAAISSVGKSFEEPQITKKVNVKGTKNLFDGIVEAGIKPTVLVISSLQIYGKPDKVPITEDAELRPASPYAESKVEQEKLCEEYADKFKIIISRSFNHTGPGQNADFVWPSFAKQIVEIETGKLKELHVGNLDVERDFSDIRDIAKAYILAVEKCEPGVYNICSGKSYNIKKMLDTLISYSTAEIKVVVDETRIRKADVPVLYGDHSKFTAATGWQPKIPLEQTLKDILEYWRKNI